MVSWWDPIDVDPDTGCAWSGNIVQYDGALKIDFSLWPVTMLERIVALPALPAELDAGYKVLLDKDQMAAQLREPTYASFIPTPPDRAVYFDNIDGFFVGVPYVAKCLLRDELLPARWCFDIDMRDVYFRPMLEWWVSLRSGWSVPLGNLGKGLKQRLPPGLWAEIETTYAGADIEDNWEALFRLVALYGRVARDVAAGLGFTYPDEIERRVVAHARKMQHGEFGLPDSAQEPRTSA